MEVRGPRITRSLSYAKPSSATCAIIKVERAIFAHIYQEGMS
jgi:hypothetical protein